MDNAFLFGELGDGRKTGLTCIEVLSCPSIQILPEYETSKEAHGVYQMEMGSLLAQIAKEYLTFSHGGSELSLEYLYVTEPVSSQLYAAKIRLFFIIRAISSSMSMVQRMLDDVAQRFGSLLRAENYAFSSLQGEEVSTLLTGLDITAASAVVREDRIRNLQSPSMPVCFSFDRIGATDCSGRRLINELINAPHCAVSFQLVPAVLTDKENQMLVSCSQMLNNMVRGISDQGTPINISYSSAAPEAETYRYYADQGTNALFRFNIVVFGEQSGVAGLSRMIVQEYAGSTSFRTALKRMPLDADSIAFSNNLCTYPWLVSEETERANQTYGVRQGMYDFSVFQRIPYLATPEEAALFFHLPIGDEVIGEGLSINESHHSRRSFNSGVINSGDFMIGTIRNSHRNDTIGMRYKDFTKHMLVTGTPGSGKTTFLVGLLDRLWHSEQHIPFLVIEPAKNEYRAMIDRIPELQVFTPGKSDISPFIFNPFLPPKNVKLESFRSTLFTAFAAAVSMQTPLDKIFEESILNCYGDFHWFDSYTSDDGGKVFNISDFIACFQKTFESIGYSGDARNIGKAGVVRLKGLEHLFDFYQSIPVEDMLRRPTLIELSSIENSEQKTLIIALVLLSILNYVNANRIGLGELQNIILLEEAHVLMDARSGNQPGEADPAAIAQKLIIRMLAEIRSYGVGMILADQSPRKVGADVVALTDTKLSFRLVEETDRQLIAASTGLNEVQTARLSKLKPGEAMLFFGRLDEPEEIVVPNFREENSVRISIPDEELKQKARYWQDHPDLMKPYPECAYSPTCRLTCDYGTKVIAKEIARRIHRRYLAHPMVTIRQIKAVMTHLSSFVAPELVREQMTDKLLACVRIHLIRLMRYNNVIVSDPSKSPAVSRPITEKDVEIMAGLEEHHA